MKRFIKDCYTMFIRCMRLTFRNPKMFIISIIIPIILLVLFTYLFDGVVDTKQFGTSYINYIFIGIITVSICQCSTTQASIIYNDIQKGMLNRFNSLPISKTSFVFGHFLAALFRTTIAVIILFIVGFMIGFKPIASFAEWIYAIGTIFSFIVAVAWSTVFLGILIKSDKIINSIPIITLILAVFSSAFIPTSNMPLVISDFMEYQPFTPIIDSIRALLLKTDNSKMLLSLLWINGIITFTSTTAIFAYKRRIKN